MATHRLVLGPVFIFAGGASDGTLATHGIYMEIDINPLTEHELARAMDINGINNPTRSAREPLTESEVRCLYTLGLRRSEPGMLKQLYGDDWYSIRDPRRFGRRFSRTVALGRLPGFKRVDKKSNTYVYDWQGWLETQALCPDAPHDEAVAFVTAAADA